MKPYSDFAPTPFDPKGLGLDDRQTWLVCPVGRTRDSGPLSQSNFESLLAMLEEADPDGVDHEVHSFNHWGPGWFDIILVRPDSKAAGIAQEAEDALQDYPVLDDEDHSRREWEECQENWHWLDMRDRIEICVAAGISGYAARREDFPSECFEALRPE